MDRSSRRDALPAEVADRIGPFYVYALVDPRNDEIFYVGKGRGDRLLSHGRGAALTEDRGFDAKLNRIHAIRSDGLEPRIDVIRHGLGEEEAFLMEAALIDLVPNLTNKVRGQDAEGGRTTMDELVRRYGAQPVDPDEVPPAVLIRLSGWSPGREEIETGYYRQGNGYRPDMTDLELVDSARAWWHISPHSVQRRGIRHGVAVHGGVTRGVMEIDGWLEPRQDGRRAFTAVLLTAGETWEVWVGPLGRRVPFTQAAQNPITYWPRNS